jgi:putative hemolysin
MTLLARASLPLVWLLDRSGKTLLWLLGHRGKAEEKVSEEEIRTLVVEAENASVLEPGEKEMIAGVMRLGDLLVGAVMTPRHEVIMIDLGAADAEIASLLLENNHSRFPVSTAIATTRSGSSTPRICSTATFRGGRRNSGN